MIKLSRNCHVQIFDFTTERKRGGPVHGAEGFSFLAYSCFSTMGTSQWIVIVGVEQINLS